MTVMWAVCAAGLILMILAVGAGLWVWTVRQLLRLRDAELEIRSAALACATQEFAALRQRVARLESIADGVDPA